MLEILSSIDIVKVLAEMLVTQGKNFLGACASPKPLPELNHTRTFIIRDAHICLSVITKNYAPYKFSTEIYRKCYP